jgi:hypothetical protein
MTVNRTFVYTLAKSQGTATAHMAHARNAATARRRDSEAVRAERRSQSRLASAATVWDAPRLACRPKRLINRVPREQQKCRCLERESEEPLRDSATPGWRAPCGTSIAVR